MEEHAAFIFRFQVLWVRNLKGRTGTHHLLFLVKVHVTCNFNDPKLLTSMLTFPPRTNFLSSVFKYTYSKRNLKWGFSMLQTHCHENSQSGTQKVIWIYSGTGQIGRMYMELWPLQVQNYVPHTYFNNRTGRNIKCLHRVIIIFDNYCLSVATTILPCMWETVLCQYNKWTNRKWQMIYASKMILYYNYEAE